MRTTKQVSIDGEEYTLGHWPVDKAAEVLAWILETFGPSFRAAYSVTDSVEETKNDIDLALRFLDSVTQNLSKVLAPKEYAARLREMTTDVVTMKGPLVYQIHFQGRLLHLHKLVLEILKYQYADFLDAARGQLGQAIS
jgi:hypothetical protein